MEKRDSTSLRFQKLWTVNLEDPCTSRTKRTSKRKTRKQAAAVGVAGAVSLLLAGVAPAAATGTQAGTPSQDIASPQQTTLNEEEIVDVSLSTFHVFDKEGARTLRGLEKVARCRACGRCQGCGGCRSCGSRCRF